MRRILRYLLLLPAIAAIILLVALHARRDQTTTFEVGDGRRVLVIENRGVFIDEISGELYYEVWQQNRRLLPRTPLNRTVFGYGSSLEYEVETAEGGQLVALLRRQLALTSLPDLEAGESWKEHILADSLMVLHDFETGVSYPAQTGSREKLLQRLLSAHPEWDEEEEEEILGLVDLFSTLDPLTQAQLESLHSLPRLRCLELGPQLLSGDMLRPLGEMDSLRELNIRYAELSDDAIPALSSLRQLQLLILPEGRLSANTRHELERALRDTTIQYSPTTFGD